MGFDDAVKQLMIYYLIDYLEPIQNISREVY